MVAWNVGYAVALAIVGVVVVLLVMLIVSASRAAAKAEAIVTALEQVRDNTSGLPQLGTTAVVADRIVASATTAREYLAGKVGG